MGLRIVGTGRALPERVVTNNELAAFLDTDNDWIVSKTGIETRVVCTRECLTDLAEAAGREAMKKAGLKAGHIDLVICSTIGGDYAMPSVACCVSQRLGINAPAFDINAACAGFVYALDTADAFISANKARHVLVISADAMSRHVDWQDRATCVLFGDGAGACVAAAGGALKYIKLAADPDISPLYIENAGGNSPFSGGGGKGFLRMNGQAVFRYAVRTIEKEVRLALAALDMSPGDADFFLLHQANRRIIDSARLRLGLPEHCFPVNVDRCGNTSGAGIPILLDEMVESGGVMPGQTLVIVAFGAGMTAGTAVVRWE